MKLTKEEYAALLRKKAAELGRYPKRSDFSRDDVVRIKSFYGPWPNALAAAGLIESKNDERLAENRARRARARQRRKTDEVKKNGTE